MNQDINLLGQKSGPVQSAFARIIRIIAISLLSIVVCITLLFFFLKAQSSLFDLQQEEGALISELNRLNVKSAKFLFIKDRLGTANTIMVGRPNLDEPFSLLKRDLAPELSVARLMLTQKEFSLTVESTSLAVMHAYVEKIEKETKSEKLLKTVKIDNVSFDQKNYKYSVTIAGQL